MNKVQAWVQATFDYTFSSPELLIQALTHRSAPGPNNERLEFLGDAVLDSVISEVVYRQRPQADEGDLSRLRSALVKDSSLAELATRSGLGDYLILGPGEKKAGGHRRASILADALEAIFGAVYLDAGYQASIGVIYRIFGDRLEDLPDPAELRDFKTRLQERLQANASGLPDYAVTDTKGKAHRQTFFVSCTVASLKLESSGTGGSRRDAEQSAAKAMLELIDKADGKDAQVK